MGLIFPLRSGRLLKLVFIALSVMCLFALYRRGNQTIFSQHLKEEKLGLSDVEVAAYRQKCVIEATKHAWSCYKRNAFGSDEVRPLSSRPRPWFRMGLTILDSVDTLALMELQSEVNEIIAWVNSSLDFNSEDVNRYNSLFEMTIRILGGCISAAFMTNDQTFKTKAIELGDIIIESIARTNSIVPLSEINVKTKTMRGSSSSLSEFGSIQLELYALSLLANDTKYAKCAYKISSFLHSKMPATGLLQMFIDPFKGTFNGHVLGLGARADSFYEYLLKQWLYLGTRFHHFLEDFLKSVNGIKAYLLRKSVPNDLWFIGEMHDEDFIPKMDHLVCFYPGVLALMYRVFPERIDLLTTAEELAYTCYETYRGQSTGLAAEITHFNMHNRKERDFYVKDLDAHNLLRPETVESLFYLYRVTRKKIYQEWGWNIFLAFNRSSRYEKCGFTAIKDVRNPLFANRMDQMDSYFLAETLKYLYLLFSDSQDEFPLDKWVFNTEGHPFPVRPKFFDSLLKDNSQN